MKHINVEKLASGILKQLMHDARYNKKERELIREELRDEEVTDYWISLCEESGQDPVVFMRELINIVGE